MSTKHAAQTSGIACALRKLQSPESDERSCDTLQRRLTISLRLYSNRRSRMALAVRQCLESLGQRLLSTARLLGNAAHRLEGSLLCHIAIEMVLSLVLSRTSTWYSLRARENAFTLQVSQQVCVCAFGSGEVATTADLCGDVPRLQSVATA